MIRSTPVLLVALAAGCSLSRAPAPQSSPAEYELRDTIRYESTLYGGNFAVLRRNGVVTDSIDLYFGFHRLNSGAVVFLPVRSAPSDIGPEGIDIGDYVIVDGDRRVLLKTILPHFSDYFSSPGVLNGVLYYWGLEEVNPGDYRIHAQRYDPAARSIDGCFLVRAEVATDNRGHFTPPRAERGGIRFEFFQHSFLVDPVLRQRASAVGATCLLRPE
jgi:hypothetical protein